jgi:uncharacterized membrane protein YhaH (DUF805 family)
MSDLFGELFDPSGRLDGRTFGWRAVIYGLTAASVGVALLIGCAIGAVADTRPLTATGRMVGLAVVVIPFAWVFLANAIRRLRDAGAGYLSLAMVTVFCLATLAFDIRLIALHQAAGGSMMLMGLGLYANGDMALLWLLYSIHLATLPSREDRSAAPVAFPEFMRKRADG